MRWRGVVAGSGVAALAGEAGRYGAAEVFVADDARLAAPLPQPRVDVLAQLVRDEGFDTVLFAQSVLATDIAAGLAARLEAGLNWDLLDLGEHGRRAGRQAGRARRLGLGRRRLDVGAAAGRLPRPVRSIRSRRGGSAAVSTRFASSRSRTRCLAELVEQAIEEPSRAVDRGRRRRRRGRPRPRCARGLRARRGARRCARRRGRRDPRRRRRRLVPVLGAGRADGQDRLAEALRRGRDLRRDPAQGRHAGARA